MIKRLQPIPVQICVNGVQSKSAQYYIEKNADPYNWTSTQWEKDKVLYVKGNWRVNNSTKVINCKNIKGVAEKYATIKITDR